MFMTRTKTLFIYVSEVCMYINKSIEKYFTKNLSYLTTIYRFILIYCKKFYFEYYRVKMQLFTLVLLLPENWWFLFQVDYFHSQENWWTDANVVLYLKNGSTNCDRVLPISREIMEVVIYSSSSKLLGLLTTFTVPR